MRITSTKATVIAALSIALLASNFAAYGAAKAGSACKKVGAVEISAGKKFTCVKSGKKLLWNKGVAIKPVAAPIPSASPTPEAIPTTTPTVAPKPTEEPAKYLDSPEPLNVCRVPDKRTTKTGAVAAIAYPVSSGTYPPVVPNMGVVNVAIIPIDFSDVPGTGSPSTLIDPEITQINKWVNHFSNGKTSYNIQTSTKWIRASKPSDQYQWEHPGHHGNPYPGAKIGPYRTPVEIATDLMRDAQNDFNYKNLNIVFFVYPKNVLHIYDAITSVSSVDTNAGRVNIQINAAGSWLYRENYPIWAWFMHENLHPTGLAGHAPYDGSPFNIMTNQAGAALVLDAWDQAILDWQRDNEIYCVSQSNLTETILPLNSIDNDEMTGTKAIFIKLSDHQVLVVESHRRAYWSQGWLGYPGLPDDFRGLLVYKIDTTIDKNRIQDGNAFATFQSLNGVQNGIYYGPYSPPFNLNNVVKEGQTLKSGGVSISLVKSGSYDTVKISKD
jgi:hypothetical protein